MKKLILFLSVTLLLGACVPVSTSNDEENKFKYEIGDIVFYKLDSTKCIIVDREVDYISEKNKYEVQVKTINGYKDYSVKEELLFVLNEKIENEKNSSYTERLINGE